MAVVALADYLPRMDARDPAPSELPTESPDRIAEAVAVARREAAVAHEAEIAALRDAQAVAAEAGIAAARDAWVAEQAAPLAAQVATAFEAVETSLAGAITRVLTPFLATVARRKAVDELVSAVHGLLRSGDAPAIRVSGPADLLARIELQLGERAASIAFMPGDEVEVTVVADRSVIATQIGAWVDRLWHEEAVTHG